jgi:hypothetical protein
MAGAMDLCSGMLSKGDRMYKMHRLGLAAVVIFLPFTHFGQQPATPAELIPEGWYLYPDSKLKELDKNTLHCFNYSHNEWRVTSEGHGVKITKLSRERGEARAVPALPPLLKHEDGMPGQSISDGLRSATHFDNAWLLAYDKGEWGGGLLLTNEDGTKTKQIISENIRGLVPIDGGVVVLSGLAHLGFNNGNAFILSNPDRLTVSLEHAFSLDSVPNASVKESDDSVLFVTTYGLHRIRKSGELRELTHLPLWTMQQYPNSMAIAPDGSLFVGMRMFVLRLRLDSGSYMPEMLLPEKCQKFELRDHDCACMP